MKSKLLISAAAIALIAAGGVANAQGMQEKQQAPKAQVQQPIKGGAEMKGGADVKSGAEMRGTTGQASPAEKGGKAEMKGEMKAGDSKADVKTRVDTKPEMKGADSKTDMKTRADSKSTNDSKTTADTKTGVDTKSKMDNKADVKSDNTTGQGAARGAANLSVEQRTKIKTVIKETNVRPVTNVNFSISIGTRVPRNIGLHPLPVTVVEYYPAWRGYEFILVGDEIIVVNPRTLEIVAVIEA